jgi:hypothetical protein
MTIYLLDFCLIKTEGEKREREKVDFIDYES